MAANGIGVGPGTTAAVNAGGVHAAALAVLRARLAALRPLVRAQLDELAFAALVQEDVAGAASVAAAMRAAAERTGVALSAEGATRSDPAAAGGAGGGGADGGGAGGGSGGGGGGDVRSADAGGAATSDSIAARPVERAALVALRDAFSVRDTLLKGEAEAIADRLWVPPHAVSAFFDSHRRRLKALGDTLKTSGEDENRGEAEGGSEDEGEGGGGGEDTRPPVASKASVDGGGSQRQENEVAAPERQQGQGVQAWAALAYRDGVGDVAAPEKRARLSTCVESADLRPRLTAVLDAHGGVHGAVGAREVVSLARAERSVSGRKLLCQVVAATADADARRVLFEGEEGSDERPVLFSLALWLKEAREDGLSTLLQFVLVALRRSAPATAARRRAHIGHAVEKLHGHSSGAVRDAARALTARWLREDTAHDATAPINCVGDMAARPRGVEDSNAGVPSQGPVGPPTALPKRPMKRATLVSPPGQPPPTDERDHSTDLCSSARPAEQAPAPAAVRERTTAQAAAMVVQPTIAWPESGPPFADLSGLRQHTSHGMYSSEANAQAVREMNVRAGAFVCFGSPGEPDAASMQYADVPDDMVPLMPLEKMHASALADDSAQAQAHVQGQAPAAVAVPPKEALSALLASFGQQPDGGGNATPAQQMWPPQQAPTASSNEAAAAAAAAAPVAAPTAPTAKPKKKSLGDVLARFNIKKRKSCNNE